jgi:acetyl-CoA decarbonylase/synthase complex subunit delta
VLCKESWGAQADNPAWGSSELRSACWEIATAISLLLSGADLLIMYHPQALETVREKIAELFASIVNI